MVRKSAAKQRMKDVEGDRERLEVMRAAREKGRISRQKKSTARRADEGVGVLAKATRDRDKDDVDLWLDKNKVMIGFVSVLMRNGLIEKNYMESTKDDTLETLNVGMRVIVEGASRWRALMGTAAVLLLAEIPGSPSVKDWFRARPD